MKTFGSIVFFFLLTSAKSQNIDPLSIGKVDHIYSKILKEKRTLFIYNPAENNNTKVQRYPVLYLLDGEEHFYATVGMIKQMSGFWGDMIVVGITNNDRNRDLTPATSYSKAGEYFMNFIEKELIPHIDSICPAAPYRIFSGHSLGGLTVINTLLNNTQLFHAYIAIDPSLWWENQKLVKEAKQVFVKKQFTNISLFIARANDMPLGMDTIAVLKDTTINTLLYRSVRQFVNNLKKVNTNGLRWNSKFYPQEVHETIPLNGEYDGLKFLFDYNQFKSNLLQIDPGKYFNAVNNVDGLFITHYKKVSKRLGYTVTPPKDLVNKLGYTCLSFKKWDKAEFFFKMNIENYPQDANVFDSMGDFYEAKGDKKNAIESFTKALTLGNDTETRKKLEQLKSKN
ncbi:MAG: alpha/beta hydrolase [Bacteroidetes bacterium]|nr:alpha/beta hydrolase [Bacteroidota bacterium]